MHSGVILRGHRFRCRDRGTTFLHAHFPHVAAAKLLFFKELFFFAVDFLQPSNFLLHFPSQLRMVEGNYTISGDFKMNFVEVAVF